MSNDQIVQFLKTTEDDKRNLEKYIDFLYTLQHSRATNMLEVVTVIKFDKPLLYSLVKPRIQSRMALKLLFDLTMDYEQSKKNLGFID
jgi:hypothetical protein